MELRTYGLTEGELQEVANQVKDVLLTTLEREGVIENSVKLCETYAVVVTRKRWLGRIIDRLFDFTGDVTKLVIVKVVSNDIVKGETCADYIASQHPQ